GDDDVAAALAAGPSAEIRFEHLGAVEDAPVEGAPVRAAREWGGPICNPARAREHALEITASLSGGRLEVGFRHGPRPGRQAVEALAERFLAALRALIAHCLSPEAGGVTPSDFEKTHVTQDMLDLIAAFDPGAAEEDEEEAH